jgi:hypothetical protein
MAQCTPYAWPTTNQQIVEYLTQAQAKVSVTTPDNFCINYLQLVNQNSFAYNQMAVFVILSFLSIGCLLTVALTIYYNKNL